MAKRLLIWAFSGKRKFNSRKDFGFDENYEEYPYKRKRNSFGNKFPKSSFMPQEKNINWDTVTLEPFVKNFYSPHPNVLNRSKEEIQRFWDENEIIINGKNCPAPIFSFEEAGLPEEINNLLKSLNYTEPTCIQAQGCPIALSGRNMVGVARTGSGKTLGFILQAVIHVQHQPELKKGDGPIALVLAPTRELVQQTQDVALPFAKAFGMNTVAVYGGSDRLSQQRKLNIGAEICVATPGRLLDFLSVNATNLNRCTYLVLDEADRMFDHSERSAGKAG